MNCPNCKAWRPTSLPGNNMKTLFLCLSLAGLAGSAFGQIQTKGSTASAPRADSTSNYVDWWLVNAQGTIVYSIFGYNSGSQQFLQIYDTTVGPTVAVTAWDATSDCFTNTAHGLSTGQRIQLTGTVAGISAGIYYVGYVEPNAFSIYDTLAHAQTGGATGKQDVTGGTSTATLNRLPIACQAIAGTDNYSWVIPMTGGTLGKGLVIANSTTAATYTAGSKNITILVTFKPL